MGFDLFGVKPKNSRGEYFRNNIWWWRKLHFLLFCVGKDVLGEKSLNGMGFNDGHLIGRVKAEIIGRRLKRLLGDEKGKKEVERKLLVFDKEIEDVVGEKSRYPFSWDNMEKFADFCLASGGFRVC